MKKIVILLSSLAGASLLLLVAATALLAAAQDDVTYTETVLAGDPAAARGLEITVWTGDNGRTSFWETTFSLGEGEPSPQTDFSHHILRQDAPQGAYANVSMNTGSTSFGVSGLLTASDADDTKLLLRPALDIAGRTPVGQERTETVSLADYYDFYPMNMDIHMQTEEGIFYYYNSEHDDDNDFTRAFQIPVPEEHRVTVIVRKTLSGEVDYVTSSTAEGRYGYHWEGAADEAGVYFYLPLGRISTEEGAADGIWVAGVEKAREGSIATELDVDIQGKRLLYPLELPQENVLGMELRGENQLLLFTWEEDALVMTVLHRETGEVLQQIETVSPRLEGEQMEDLRGRMDNHYEEDFLLVSCGGDFMVLEDRGGEYIPALEGRFRYPELAGRGWLMGGSEAVDWDGERLAVVRTGGSEHLYHMGLELVAKVYDQTGLLYAGEYTNSIGRDPATAAYHAYYATGKRPEALFAELTAQ